MMTLITLLLGVGFVFSDMGKLLILVTLELMSGFVGVLVLFGILMLSAGK